MIYERSQVVRKTFVFVALVTILVLLFFGGCAPVDTPEYKQVREQQAMPEVTTKNSDDFVAVFKDIGADYQVNCYILKPSQSTSSAFECVRVK